jgi:hypothetical protein
MCNEYNHKSHSSVEKNFCLRSNWGCVFFQDKLQLRAVLDYGVDFQSRFCRVWNFCNEKSCKVELWKVWLISPWIVSVLNENFFT